MQYTLLDNGCVEGLAVGILAVILLTTLFVLCLVYYRHRSVVVVLFFSRVISRSCYKHGRPQAWATGALAPLPPLEMLKVVFLLQMLSKTSVDEVLMHHFEKMSASGSFAPDPHRGAAPGPCWGTSVLQTPSLPTTGKIMRAPMVINVSLSIFLQFTSMKTLTDTHIHRVSKKNIHSYYWL